MLCRRVWAFALLTMPGEKHALGSPFLPEQRETGRTNLNPTCRMEPRLAEIGWTLPTDRLATLLMLYVSHYIKNID